ncbi:hypothetical protein ACHAXT_005435 [Thalassiosira profunda]
MREGYGAIDGVGGGDSEHAEESSTRAASVREFLARPLVRGAAALCLVLIMVLSGSRTPASPSGTADDNASDAHSTKVAGYHNEDEELFYDEQLVDHFNGDKTTWSNRYYKSTNYFEGPGHPIFLVVGGEGALDDGMLYPFITQHLAPHFGAAVVQIEHRFYGPYQPIVGREATTAELLELLTPQQALADMVQLTKAFKEELGCAQYDRGSEKYCPVISVGGSYPGFLSAMFRVVHPDFVDISYASSAPLKLYDQTADQNAYYDIVTKAAERLSPGCAHAVRVTLQEARQLIRKMPAVADALESMNMCVETAPEYITTTKTLSRDVMMAVGFSFADYDMDAYPPSEDLGLYKACRAFQDKKATTMEKVANFFQLLKSDADAEEENPGLVAAESSDCFDLTVFLPDGENARITTSDWSGSGGGNDGKMWDFQLCTTLIDPIGFSEESMFPARKWTYESLTEYCQMRYGEEVTPQPLALSSDMGFNDLLGIGASHILFTNGLQDMWSGGSYLEDLSDTILALNFENGAHHSDINHVGPTEDDTDDIREGYVKITNILEKWLDGIKSEARRARKE